MKNNYAQAQQLFDALLSAFNEGTEAVLKLFGEDASVEYPYAKSVDGTARLNMDEYRKHLDNILGHMPAISFSGGKLQPLEEANGYWVELHGETTVPQTAQRYRQDYVIRFTIKDGNFFTYKEYWNPLPVLQSLMKPEDAQRILADNKNSKA